MKDDLKLKRHMENQKTIKRVREAITVVIDETNSLGSAQCISQGIFEALTGSHRTLQQSFMRELVEALEQYSKTNFFDARNEASVKLAGKIVELDHHLPFI